MPVLVNYILMNPLANSSDSTNLVAPSAGLNLKIMLLNAENLFLISDESLQESHLELDEKAWQKLSTSVFDNKPLRKCRALAKIVQEVNPDIIMLAEVGGSESLSNFNRLFLNDRFSTALIEGNSNRNIDVGYLIRKNMGFYFDLVSNKNRPINFLYAHEKDSLQIGEEESAQIPASHKFSRDVAELHLFTKDRSRPFLLLLLAHLKSRLDPDGIDANGLERRQAELQTLVNIYLGFENQWQGKIPIVVAGDFNGNASQRNTDLEFRAIYDSTQLKDVCALANLPPESCATYYQVGRHSHVEGRQIDYSFLSPAAAPLLLPESVKIYRYKDHLGQPMDPPSTLDAKSMLPSDHYPLIFELNNIPVID